MTGMPSYAKLDSRELGSEVLHDNEETAGIVSGIPSSRNSQNGGFRRARNCLAVTFVMLFTFLLTAIFKSSMTPQEEVEQMRAPPPSKAHVCFACTEDTPLSIEGRIGFAEEPTCDMLSRSTKYSKKCGHHYKHAIYDLLVTCTGRSGSTFVYGFLNKLGFNIGHDQVDSPYGHGAVAWPMLFSEEPFKSIKADGTSSSISCKYISKTLTKRFNTLIHMVRHPLRSIRSRWNTGNFFMGYAKMGWYRSSVCNTNFWNNWPEKMPFRSPPQSNAPDLLSLVATIRHWVLWNTFASATSEWGFRLEQFIDREQTPGIIREMCSRANINKKKCPTESQVRNLHSNVGTYSRHSKKVLEWEFSWHVLFRADPEYALLAQMMAIRYGYTVTAGELLPPLYDRFCTGTRDSLPVSEGFNATTLEYNKRIVCDLKQHGEFPEPLCSLDALTKKWGCVVPPELDFDPANYTKPHFPFSTKGEITLFRGKYKKDKRHGQRRQKEKASSP